MDKILDESLAELNIQKLRELFPNIVSDGGGIDFEILRSLLGSEIDASPEKFQFTWNGKINSIKFSQLPSTGTLRPSPSESKDWKCTKNTYIEGDNLEVLKLLQKNLLQLYPIY